MVLIDSLLCVITFLYLLTKALPNNLCNASFLYLVSCVSSSSYSGSSKNVLVFAIFSSGLVIKFIFVGSCEVATVVDDIV